MQIAKESYDTLINVGSGVLLFIVALAFAWAAERYGVPYLLFFTGWLMRSAWAKTEQAEPANDLKG